MLGFLLRRAPIDGGAPGDGNAPVDGTIDGRLVTVRPRTGCQAGGKREGMRWPGWCPEGVQGEQGRGSLPSRPESRSIFQGLCCA